VRRLEVVTLVVFANACGLVHYEPAAGDGGATDAGEPPPLPTGLFAHWKLDESTGTTAVESEQGFDGSLSGSPTWSPTEGQVAGALAFNGTSGAVAACSLDDCSNALDDLAAMTVTAWIRPNSMGQNGTARIALKGASDSSTGWRIEFNGTNAIQFSIRGDTSDASFTTIDDAIQMTPTAWQHLAVTWDGVSTPAGIRIFIDGVESSYANTDQDGGSMAISDAADPLVIGNSGPAGNRAFDGLIDDVRIYSRVLSASEVQNLYRATCGGC